METTFWILLAFIIYTYSGYPLLLLVLRAIIGKPIRQNKQYQPSVSFIVAAYNEQDVIENKILNTLELDYPKELLETIIVSDCSSDETDNIVSRYVSKGIKLLSLEKRGGKTVAQNESLKHVTGEILVFSDANTMYRPTAIRKIVRNFSDPEIGCVGGVLTYEAQNQKELIKEKGIYLSFDQHIKKLEGEISSCIGVDGAIYAIRNNVARPLPETLTTDFIVPLDVISQGFRSVFESEAITCEQVASSSKVEFKRKMRTVRVGATVLYAMRHLLNPFKYGWVSFFLFSHKLLRWLFPFLMISFFATNALLIQEGFIYSFIFYLQMLFYLFAFLGFLIKKTMPVKLFTVPFYFCMYNVCAIVGLFNFIFGEKTEIWEVER